MPFPDPAGFETTWRIGEHASPDMGNVAADGTQLWLSGRYHRDVYVLSAEDGQLWLSGRYHRDVYVLSAEDEQLWLSGHYHRDVYVLSVVDGQLTKRIDVGNGPHGLCMWPQLGRYSLSPTGITR